MKRLLSLALPALLLVPNLAPAQATGSSRSLAPAQAAGPAEPSYSRGSAVSNPGTFVRSDYEGYLRREPTPSAERLREARMNGHTPQAIQASILSSDEYYTAAGGTTPTYVRQLYMDVVGRDPLPAEVNYWVGRLAYQSRQDVTYQMLRHHPQSMNTLVAPAPYYNPGYYPDPTDPTFRDPGGPYFHSPYFYNYEKSRPIRAFETRARG